MAELTSLLEAWRRELAAWAIPEHISAAVAESPWVLPRQVFARRADRLSSEPSGPSYERAWAALDPPGSVLDVGAGAGAACLPLLGRTTALTAVDSDAAMLALLAERAAAAGVTARCVPGRWPEAAAQIPAADVVTCHHVLYNAPGPAPFAAALTARARRLVIVEVTASHPLVTLNGLWLRFHGLRRPDGPTADDLLAILTAHGPAPRPPAVAPPRRGGLCELRRAHRHHPAAAVPAARARGRGGRRARRGGRRPRAAGRLRVIRARRGHDLVGRRRPLGQARPGRDTAGPGYGLGYRNFLSWSRSNTLASTFSLPVSQARAKDAGSAAIATRSSLFAVNLTCAG